MCMFVELSDEALIEAYKAKADDMSFFSAAEGQSWYQEAVARGKCQVEFTKISEELKSRGIPIPKGNWLI